MDIEDKELLKNEIINKIETLKKNIFGLEKLVKPIGPDRAFGKVGRIDAMQYKEIQEAGLRAAENTLIELERALINIDAPDFGVCEYCGTFIGYERIKALPGTNKCVKCAEKGF